MAQELAKEDGVEFYGEYFPIMGWSTYAVTSSSRRDFQAALAFLLRTEDKVLFQNAVNLVEKFQFDTFGTDLIFY